MKSIRLSLIVCFLVLLGLSLGAVSMLLYQTTRATLRDKEGATQALLLEQARDRERQVKENIERELSYQATALANLVQLNTQFQQRHLQGFLAMGGLWMSGYTPKNFLSTGLTVWLGQWVPGEVSEGLRRRLSVTEIRLPEDELPSSGDRRIADYFQINTERGAVWRSPSMGNLKFPFDRREYDGTPLAVQRFDEIQLDSGRTVYRLRIKTLVREWSFQFGPRPRHIEPPNGRNGRMSADPPPPRPPRPSGPRSRGDGFQQTAPRILIQCGCDTTGRDADIAAIRSELRAEQAKLAAESQAALSALRNRLLWISLVTFAAAVAACLWLVQLGLSPLQRLSEAVSRVSPKDFRLEFDDSKLPRELRPIVARLDQTLDQLKRAFAREKQAAADISHDLRTPLAALLTTTEVALRKPRSSEEYREILQDCHATGQQMSQLVERLLTLARLDAGVDTLRPRAVDVAALADQCAALVRPLATARGLTLDVHRNGPVNLQVDPDKLREVLTNLLHNAIEYNRPDGRVDVTIERDNGHLRVAIQDTGIGVAPEARAHIFERFYRADPSRQADGLHAGLGLAIVKGYVELMGGTIEVESVKDQGSTFSVTLPVRCEN